MGKQEILNDSNIQKRLMAFMVSHLTGNGIDLMQDYIELTLDDFLHLELLKDIPLVGTALKLGKSALTIRNLIMTRNYCIFISDLRREKETQRKLQEHLSKLENQPGKMQKNLRCYSLIWNNIKKRRKQVIWQIFIDAILITR